MVMRIQMRSETALIGIETQNGKLEIEQPPANYELDIEHARIEIDSEPAELSISQVQAFAESGLKSILKLTAENAQVAKQLVLQGISRASRQGDEIADISKPNPIPDHAKANFIDQFKKDYNIQTIPVSGPDIQVNEGELNIEVIEGKAELRSTPNKPVINYTHGKVKLYMERYNSLEIWTTGSQLDITI